MTPTQQRFVEEYLVDLNATQAAIRAGYSQKTAYSIGHENLRKPEIRETMARARDAQSARAQISADRVLRELAGVAFTDITRVVEWGPAGMKLKDLSGLSAEELAGVAHVSQKKTKRGGCIRVRMHDKVKALAQMAQHLGLLQDRR